MNILININLLTKIQLKTSIRKVLFLVLVRDKIQENHFLRTDLVFDQIFQYIQEELHQKIQDN